MGQAVLQLIPLGLAAALSSIPMTATVFILLSETRSRSGLAFMAGMVLGTLAAVTLATVAGQALPGRQHQHDALIGKLEVVIGIAMVLMGVILIARGARGGSSGGTGWQDSIGSFGLVPVFGIALALNIRPKAVLLVAAAGLAISRADLQLKANLVLALLYTVIATSTVVIPIVATLLFPRWMEPRLRAAKGRIAAHSTAASATIMIVIGGFVMGVGISG